MSCGDYKLQNIIQLTRWGMVMVEGSLVECLFLLLSKDSFPSSDFVSSPCRCFRSCIFQLEIHSITVLSIGPSCWVVTQSVTCRFTCLGSSSQNCSFPDLFMYFFISLSHHQIMSICSFCHSHGDSIQDGLHGSCIQLQCDSAQGIHGHIVPSPLVFNVKSESHKWLYPMVLGSI